MKLITRYNNTCTLKYDEFIIECSKKDYTDESTHIHHILPKFMGGTNDDENLIILSYNDHLTAHLLLAECFDWYSHEYYGNISSALFVKKWIDSPVDLREVLSKALKGRKRTPEQIQRMSECQKGKKASDATKRKMSESRKGKRCGSENPRFGKLVTDETRLKISKANSGKGNGMYGKTHNEETRKIISDKLKGMNRGSKNSNSKPIQNSETGIIYGSYADVYVELNLTYYMLSKLIKLGKFIVLDKQSI
jgi:hypothetical protein